MEQEPNMKSRATAGPAVGLMDMPAGMWFIRSDQALGAG